MVTLAHKYPDTLSTVTKSSFYPMTRYFAQILPTAIFSTLVCVGEEMYYPPPMLAIEF